MSLWILILDKRKNVGKKNNRKREAAAKQKNLVLRQRFVVSKYLIKNINA